MARYGQNVLTYFFSLSVNCCVTLAGRAWPTCRTTPASRTPPQTGSCPSTRWTWCPTPGRECPACRRAWEPPTYRCVSATVFRVWLVGSCREVRTVGSCREVRTVFPYVYICEKVTGYGCASCQRLVFVYVSPQTASVSHDVLLQYCRTLFLLAYYFAVFKLKFEWLRM